MKVLNFKIGLKKYEKKVLNGCLECGKHLDISEGISIYRDVSFSLISELFTSKYLKIIFEISSL